MPIRVHGNWVTESGDTIYTDEADATPGSPITGSNVSAAFYPRGLNITGGTGRFAGARGNLNILFGAGDSVSGQFIYRYQGQICFTQPKNISAPRGKQGENAEVSNQSGFGRGLLWRLNIEIFTNLADQ